MNDSLQVGVCVQWHESAEDRLSPSVADITIEQVQTPLLRVIRSHGVYSAA